MSTTSHSAGLVLEPTLEFPTGSPDDAVRLAVHPQSFEYRWPAVILPVFTLWVPCSVLAGQVSVLMWLTCCFLVVPLVGALGRGQLRTVVIFTALHLSAFVLFMALRDYADQTGVRVQYGLPILIDRWIGGGSLPTAWLQARFHDPSRVSWIDRLMFVVYGCHLFALWLTGYALWERHVPRFACFSLASGVSYLCALPMHFLAPTAPPWMAAREGLIEPVSRIFWSVGREIAPRTIEAGISLTGNDVAAMPSVHMAAAVLIAMALWELGTARRLIGLCYATAVFWSVVYGAEHYVADAIAGGVLGVAAWHAASRLLEWEPLTRLAETAPPIMQLVRTPER